MRKMVTIIVAAILYFGVLYVGSQDLNTLSAAKVKLGQKTYQVLEIID